MNLSRNLAMNPAIDPAIGRAVGPAVSPAVGPAIGPARRPALARVCRGVLAGLVAGLITACASPLPPPRLYQLRAAPPVAVAAVPSTQVLQLMAPVRLPELLDRPELLLPQGQAGVQALGSHRWAEPLRDAVPRLLHQDLAVLLGQARVWAAPVPAGVAITRQLRVEVLLLQATADRSAVQLQARCTLSDPAGKLPPRVTTLDASAPSASAEPDALVAAHRRVLWQWAEQLAAWANAPGSGS